MDAGRFRHLSGKNVVVEPSVADSVMAALRGLGHTVRIGSSGQFGGSQAILKLPRGYVGGSDSRKDGHAGGH